MYPATLINLEKWNKIPEDLQDMIMGVMKDMEYIATMRIMLIKDKEENIRKNAGMKYLQLPPADAEKFRHLAYDKTWEVLYEKAPQNGQALRKLSSKKALPKGAFPWQ